MTANTMANGRRVLSRALGCLAVLLGLAGPATGQIVEYYHLDALGSVRAMSNEAGEVIERHNYLPFGEEWEANPTAPGDPRKFTGKERDTETGLDYFGARYYTSGTGRFTTVDPVITLEENLVDPQRWNRYAYVRNNPLRYTDPDGRALESGWDIFNVVTGVGSLVANVAAGSWGSAAIDLAGTIYDAGATAIPGLPGGASAAIKATRAASKAKDAIQAATATKSVVSNGTKVFRVWGDEAGAWGKSWTTVDPRTVPGYRDAAGLPKQNTGRFLSEGVLQNTQGVTTRKASPLHGNKGGLPEVVVPKPQSQIRIQNVQGLNPEF